MKTLWTAVILMFSLSCIADPAIRNSPKRAPLRGNVKKVRSSGYGALSEAGAKSMTFDTSRYTIDSFSKAGLKLYTQWIWGGGIADRVDYKYDATYKYDEHDNEVLAEEHAQDGTIGMQFITEYIYDSHGNWIRCIEDYPNDIDDIPPAKQVSIREIEYYSIIVSV